MENKKLMLIAAKNAVLTGLYVAAVAIFMTYAGKIVGQANSALGGIAILLLFTLSAAIVGTLILGKPLMMYLDGQKQEAIKTLLRTIFWLSVLTVLAIVILAIL